MAKSACRRRNQWKNVMELQAEPTYVKMVRVPELLAVYRKQDTSDLQRMANRATHESRSTNAPPRKGSDATKRSGILDAIEEMMRTERPRA